MAQALMRPEVAPIPLTEPVWSRQELETDAAFLGFTLYRDLGLGRSVSEAWRVYSEQRGLIGKQSQHFYNWSQRFRWKERAAAYDNHLDSKEIAAQKRRRIQAATRHADVQVRAQEVLEFPLQQMSERIQEILEKRRENDLDEMSTEDLIRLNAACSKALNDSQRSEREALGSNEHEEIAEQQNLKVRGQVLRKYLGSPDAIGMLEAVAFELTAGESNDDNGSGPAPIPLELEPTAAVRTRPPRPASESDVDGA